MTLFLQFLDGKKAIISMFLTTIISYLVATQVITPELGTLLTGILAIMTGTAVVATNQTLGKAYRAK